MGLPDIVYLCGPRVGDELRYSMRTLVNLPHRRVWLAGHIPRWAANVGTIPVKQNPNAKWRNQNTNLLTAVNHPDVAERFLLFNDDFFVMQPVDEVPVWHRGPFTDALLNRFASKASGNYGRRMRETADLIGRDQFSYELHVPLPMEKAKTRITVESMPEDLLFRSIYGADWRIGGIEHDDVKVKAADRQPDGPFVSTSDTSFRSRPIGRRIRAAFREPGRYER
jgi:hypothetical protein